MVKDKSLSWAEYLKPNLAKFCLSILTAFLWILIQIAIILIQNPGVRISSTVVFDGIYLSFYKTGLVIINAVSITIDGILWNTFWFYLFASSVYFLYLSHRENKFVKTLKIKKVLFGLIVFNPYVLTIIGNLLYLSLIMFSLYQLPYFQCGVLVKGVFPDSPASAAGIVPDSVIYKVNGIPVNNITTLGAIQKDTRPGQTLHLWLSYGNGTYGALDVTLGAPPENLDIQGGYFGVNVTDRFVKYDSQCSGR